MKVTLIKVDPGVDVYGPDHIVIKHGINEIEQEKYDTICNYPAFQQKIKEELYHVRIVRKEGEEKEVIPLPGDSKEDKKEKNDDKEKKSTKKEKKKK